MSDLENVFKIIYKNNLWNDPESVSGIGSTLDWTSELRKTLPQLLENLKVTSLLDAGCGDWNWMSRMEWDGYKVEACDIVPELIANNIRQYGRQALFFVADITAPFVSDAELILCRTVLFHLSFENILKALRVFADSDTVYLLMTHHPHITENLAREDGDFRRLNFCIEPFNLPKPELMLRDGIGDDGYLCLWKLEDIEAVL
jgi:SAM-dependent methyltransferase